MIIAGVHDHFLVFLSLLIAAFASFTALSIAIRIRASSGWMKRIWLAAAALALGGGIWSMHFVAMLAFSMPGIGISYDLALTLFSLALALAFTGVGFAVMSWRTASIARVILAGLLMGSGVVAMHYVGMAAMRMDATLSYERPWVGISVLIAIGAATAAVWLASRDQKTSHRIAAAAIMGSAIAGMHYAGMRAAVFSANPAAHGASGSASLSQTYLAVTISAVTVLILLLALGAARIDRTFQAYGRREARSAIRLRIADALRSASTKDALQEVAAMMGEHFAVSRTGFGHHDARDDQFDFDTCWTDGTVPALLGRLPAADFGAKIVAELRAGRTVVVEDLLEAPLSNEPKTRDTARKVDTRAILVVPFVRDARIRTIIYLNDRHPRRWHADDVQFLEELADQTRLVIERAAVEEQLRELNATLEARVEARTTQLQQAEAARRETDALHRAYFENTPDPLFVIRVQADGNFVVEQVNPAHEASIGLRLADIRGQRVSDILPDNAAAKVMESYRRVVSSATIYRYREIFDLDGSAQHWDTTLVPLTNDQGEVERIIGSSRNITGQMLAEEALRQSQKMEAMGQLTGGVAHDFNNLLTPIIGALDRLQRKAIGDERDRKLIAGAAQSAERAKTLVHRLLSFARRQPLQTVPVDMARLVTGMSDLIASTAGPRITLTVEAEDDLPAALADPNQIEMALLNLSVNARDAMPDGGALRIAVAAMEVEDGHSMELKPGAYICLTVTDTGIGMDETTLKRAIDPFFSTKGVGRGTGLGLSMAHGLAAQLGGSLSIDSELGKGTQVRLCLPQSEHAPDEAAAASVSVAAPSSPGKVLLIDDETLVRESTAEMLADLGYQVETACSAAKAVDMLERGAVFDVVITDHLMPGMTGTELARHVLRAAPNTKVLVISGYADSKGIDPSLPRLTKPFLQAELAAKLAELGPLHLECSAPDQ